MRHISNKNNMLADKFYKLIKEVAIYKNNGKYSIYNDSCFCDYIVNEDDTISLRVYTNYGCIMDTYNIKLKEDEDLADRIKKEFLHVLLNS